jgi:hypothetical protein
MKRNTNTPLQGATLRRRIKSIGKKKHKKKKKREKNKNPHSQNHNSKRH